MHGVVMYRVLLWLGNGRLLTSSRATLLARGQSYDSLSASRKSLRDVCKLIAYIPPKKSYIHVETKPKHANHI